MTDNNRTSSEKSLWRRVAPRPEAGFAPDPGIIAAWLEGRLNDAELAAMDQRLADSPEWLEAAVLARTATEGADEEVVPQSIVARACELSPNAVPVRQPQNSIFQLLVSRWLEAITTAGAVVTTGLLGFMLGQSTIENFAHTEALLATELPAELEYILASNLEDAPTTTILDWEEQR